MIYISRKCLKDGLNIKYNYGRVEVLIQISECRDIFIMTIGFRVVENKYHNLISKEIQMDSNYKYYIINKLIPNIVFKNFSEHILNQGSIEDFWNVLKDKLENYKKYETKDDYIIDNMNKEKPYFWYARRCSKDISNNKTEGITTISEEKIKCICGEDFYNYLIEVECKPVFTSDINKAKKCE